MLYTTFLHLDDGTTYKGWSFFDDFMSAGEIVFNTGMTGYQEVMTDPSYSGQIMTFTYPELGNTGLNLLDNESNMVHVRGIIAKNICSYPYHWCSQISLKDYIILKRIPHIFGLDTRSLTKYLRTCGVMNGYIISQNLNNSFTYTDNKLIENLDLVKRVTTKQVSYLNINNFPSYNSLNIGRVSIKSFNYNIVLIDFGVKKNIVNRLLYYGCNIYILPANATYELIKSYHPDGILLSNGPGNPESITYAVNTLQKLINFSNIPIFGICMGHQILSLALGAKTYKLKFGHRGLNHPSGKSQSAKITSQNHGFAVSLNSLMRENLIQVTDLNLNDLTIAGMLHKKKPIFSIQYHPEASPGPHDSDYLFNIFINLITIIREI